ncbi:hypothetical protein AAFF_G00253620 [Aldrovandia affinis]|uniref:Uncharacterized protein n=1 Tax=Aldrovandia affinis TaxID=143900 RepID=A0AAD7SV39_9TELE|nr:hypothetical protein AAFF_G00253620 [Aldrovandia affinis]
MCESTDLGSRRELRSVPFITYVLGLLKTQLLADDPVSGVEVRCEEKGHCPSACHLCRQPGPDTPSPAPALLEVSRIVPLYSLVQDNVTKEGSIHSVFLSPIPTIHTPPVPVREQGEGRWRTDGEGIKR